jgi:glycyl-tRNA synthetase alpha chain
MSRRADPALIGAFVLGALALAIATILLVAGDDWFRKHSQHTLYFEGAAHGLQVGAPVVFLGVKVGTVKKIQLGLDESSDTFVVPVAIEVEPQVVRTKSGERIDLRDREALRRLIERGLRARLRMQSILTGQLYVDLDFHPDKPARFVAPDPAISEIPTIRTAVQELTRKLEGFPMDTFLADVAAIGASLNQTLNTPETRNLPRRLDPTFQQSSCASQNFWAEQGCALLQPYDIEVGAGTFHTATFLRSLGPEPWNAAYVQPSRRPKDGRYGENPNRLQHYYQYQVVLKPSPPEHPGAVPRQPARARHRPQRPRHPLRRGRLGEPHPGRLGPGLGSLAGRHGGDAVHLLPAGRRPRAASRSLGEITYGLERLAMYLQGVENVYDLVWSIAPMARLVTYGDVYHQNEVEQSTYNFEHSQRRLGCSRLFGEYEAEAKRLMAVTGTAGLRDGAEGRHTFNLLDARGAISVTERAAYIGRIRNLARASLRPITNPAKPSASRC